MATAIATARDLAQGLAAMAQRVRSRSATDLFEYNLLAGHPAYQGVWSAWEPNIFDGQDATHRGTTDSDARGRYGPWWSRGDNGKLGLSAMDDLTPSTDAWYLEEKAKLDDEIYEPYSYKVQGVNTLLTSVQIPIKINGKFAGVAGVDLALTGLSADVNAIKAYGTGTATLVSSAGNIVAGGAASQLTKPLAGELGALAAKARTSGTLSEPSPTSTTRAASWSPSRSP